MTSKSTGNSLSTCPSCDQKRSSFDCDRPNSNTKNYVPVQRKVIYSGIGTETEESIFKHVNGCYCAKPPIKPFVRFAREPKPPTLRRKIINQFGKSHGVKRVPKIEAQIKNAFTQTSLTDDEDNAFFDLNCSDDQGAYERISTSNLTDKKLVKIPKCDKSKKLIEFHKEENDMESHSSPNLTPPDHECIHHFRINDRFLPEPVNSDPSGNSLCVICNKILGVPPEKISPRTKSPSRKEKGMGSERLKKKDEYYLKRPVVGIGTGREVLKIDVPAGLEECSDERRKEIRFPKAGKRLFNSLALRHQKRVVS